MTRTRRVYIKAPTDIIPANARLLISLFSDKGVKISTAIGIFTQSLNSKDSRKWSSLSGRSYSQRYESSYPMKI